MSDDAGRKRPPSIGEYFLNELRQAFQDVRQKLVEEGWFGRVTTATPIAEIERADVTSPEPLENLTDHRSSFAEQWAPRERDAHAIDLEHGMEIDR